MPTVRGSVDAELEFSLYCAVCGDGICGEAKYRSGSDNAFDISCPKCEKANESELRKRDETIAELESKVADLEKELDKMKEGV